MLEQGVMRRRQAPFKLILHFWRDGQYLPDCTGAVCTHTNIHGKHEIAGGRVVFPLPEQAHAICSTYFPIGTMRPVSSAIGINTIGEIVRRSGCCHGSRASAPTPAPFALTCL